MPGVNLDFLPASEAPEALGSPDSACAESGLEEVIGDLLAQEEIEDEDEQFCKRKYELTLRCAVGEMHSDLQAFGKRVDARLEAAAAQVAPLAEAFARLQEENRTLRIQQERLVRQVEVLCQVMGLPDPLLHVLPSEKSLPAVPCETNTPSRDPQASSGDPPTCTPQDTAVEAQCDTCIHQDSPSSHSLIPTLSSDPQACKPQDTALEAPHDASSCTPQGFPSIAPQDTPDSTLLDSLSPQEPLSCLQDLTETSTPQDSGPSPVPHPPTFATRRSLSAPSLMADISYDNSTVLLSVNGSDHDPF